MSRQVQGLRLAWRTERPPGLPKFNKPRGAKRDGVLYERAVGAALPAGALGALWWRFEDQNGTGVCQTDWIIAGARSVLVLECKLGQHWEAWKQLEDLYCLVVGRALGLPVIGVQVCKFLRREYKTPGEVLVTDLAEAIAVARAGVARPVLHWSGLGPIWTGAKPSHTKARLGASRPMLVSA
jgi:hypothetical protein